MTRRAELAIVDDDDAVLDSLRTLLAGHGFDQISTYPSAEALLAELAEGRRPALIVSDVRMSGMSGLDLQAELVHRNLEMPLILITGHGQVSMAVKAVKAGALDFIEKPFDEATLIGAIERGLAETTKREEENRVRDELAGRLASLSQRQRQVMDLVVEGYSSKEIAAKLGISPRTVETYRLWIMEKTGVRNLAELVRMVTQINGGHPGPVGAANVPSLTVGSRI